MSGVSTQGVGLAGSAKAGVVIAVSATVIKRDLVERDLVENPVILHAPQATRLNLFCDGAPVEQITNADLTLIRRSLVHTTSRFAPRAQRQRVWDFPLPSSRLWSGFKARRSASEIRHRDNSDELRHEIFVGRFTFAGDAGSCCPRRRIQAFQQPANFL